MYSGIIFTLKSCIDCGCCIHDIWNVSSIEMMASLNRPVPVNTNRERRIRYSHPKGAPDADLIFGSK